MAGTGTIRKRGALIALLCALASSAFAPTASAEFTFPPLRVSGWDDATDLPIWHPSHSGQSHLHMGGFYTIATMDALEILDRRIFNSAIEAGFGDKLPKTVELFHQRHMDYRCANWVQSDQLVAHSCIGPDGTFSNSRAAQIAMAKSRLTLDAGLSRDASSLQKAEFAVGSQPQPGELVPNFHYSSRPELKFWGLKHLNTKTGDTQ